MRGPTGRLGSLGLALAGVLAGCEPAGPSDPLAARCVEVLRFRHRNLVDLRVREALFPAETERTLRFEGVLPGTDSRIASEITCAFAPGGRWTLARVVVGGRDLNEAELALVNSELLLRDLSENPERLGSPRGS